MFGRVPSLDRPLPQMMFKSGYNARIGWKKFRVATIGLVHWFPEICQCFLGGISDPFCNLDRPTLYPHQMVGSALNTTIIWSNLSPWPSIPLLHHHFLNEIAFFWYKNHFQTNPNLSSTYLSMFKHSQGHRYGKCWQIVQSQYIHVIPHSNIHIYIYNIHTVYVYIYRYDIYTVYNCIYVHHIPIYSDEWKGGFL